ncbi:MAG: CPBP family intramembrane metalloprotease [Actinomycetota bacterium]|nr:CPBP family intramembrane metalloprotease [Actinomycetota bacterium]
MATTDLTRFDPRPVVTFFALAYAISWAWVIPWAASGHTVAQGQGWPTHLPSLLGPMLAAFVVTAFTTGRDGIRDLLIRMVRWRIGWRWWAIVLSPLAFFFLVLGVLTAAGADLPPRGDFARFSGVSAGLGVVGVALIIALVNGFGEETGWRGFALPQLQRRFGPIAASLIIAVLWAGWHIPQFFFLKSYQDFSIAMLPVFVFGLTCGAVLWTWIYNRTGSILAVAAWHGLYNMTGATKAATGGSGVISAAMWTFVVVAALALLHADRRARRAGRPSILVAPPAAGTAALAAS